MSLAELAAERGCNISRVIVALEELGIKPALDPEVFKSRFYKQADLVVWRSQPWP